MDTLDCKFQVKQVTEEGTFEGWLSVYNVLDLGGDIVEKGAFSKTLQDSGGRVPLLWFHDMQKPIGSLEVQDRDKGLWVKGKLSKNVRQAQEALELLRDNVVKGLSIGFAAVKKEFKAGVRHLKEIKLYEGSLVLFQMTPGAEVTSVKSVDTSILDKSLKELKELMKT